MNEPSRARLVAYLRVSTDSQAEHGHGIEVQRRAITQWAKARGARIVLCAADEGVSGSNGLEAREGLLEALQALQSHHADGLVVYKLDRLARDFVVQESLLRELWRLDAKVFSTFAAEDHYLDPVGSTDDPTRALIRQILGAVGEYERSMIRLRMRAGKDAKKRNGGFIGGQVPTGYRSLNGELVEDEHEQRAIRRMQELRAQGASYRAICAALACEGLRPKRAARWQSAVVRRILLANGAR